tara:strand:+ start:190 stop:369 length:180 start_codon:yes stop_codon:yes gene_type:complete
LVRRRLRKARKKAQHLAEQLIVRSELAARRWSLEEEVLEAGEGLFGGAEDDEAQAADGD